MSPTLSCGQVLDTLPAYLANHLSAAELDAVAAHVEACPDCAMNLAAERRLDQLIAGAVDDATPAEQGLRYRVRAQIVGEAPRRRGLWWRFASIAATVATLVLGAGLWYGAGAWQTHLLCVDAADDHRTEVTGKQPLRWRTKPEEITQLAQRVGASDVPKDIGPDHLALNRGRICNLRGVRFLHLVYGGPSREVSVFLAPAPGSQDVNRTVEAIVHQEHDMGVDVSTFRTGNLVVVVASDIVTSLSNQVALELAHHM
jgi:anti-sigma factor RsiW